MMKSRKNKVLLVLSASSIILVWRVFALVNKYAPARAEAAPAVSPESPPSAAGPLAAAVAQATAQSPVDWQRQDEVIKQPWGRNPFAARPRVISREERPQITPVRRDPPDSPATRIKLTGVSRSGDQWLAAAGGIILRKGDVIEDRFTVSSISHGSITLQCEGWEWIYALGSETPVMRQASEGP